MDLKEILEKEYREVNTVCSGYEFTVTPERNLYNAIRNKYKALAIEASEKFKKMDAEFEDITDIINNASNAFIVAVEDILNEVLQDIISVGIYDVDKQQVIDLAFEGTYFNEFSESYGNISKRFDKILSELNDAEFSREMRKNNRPRWQSATIGGNAINAWSNQLDAAAMNITEGIAHSVINAIANAIDRSIAEADLKKLFANRTLRDDMIYSVYLSGFNLHMLLVSIVKSHNITKNIGTVEDNDKNQATAMYNNFMSITLAPEKQKEFILKIFELNPYDKEFYKGIIEKNGDKDNSFSDFANYFCVDIYKTKQELVVKFVNENIGDTEDDAYECRKRAIEYAQSIGLAESNITEANNIIDERLAELDKIYRTVDDIEFETRDEADIAKSELSQIEKIMENVVAPEKDPTLSYEREILEKKEAIEALTTKVKEKYITILDKHLYDFDKKFKTISLIEKAQTREEAVRKKAFNSIKKLKFNRIEDVQNARDMIKTYIADRGVEFEQLVEVNNYLNQIENDMNNGVDVNKFTNKKIGLFGGKSVSDIFSGFKK